MSGNISDYYLINMIKSGPTGIIGPTGAPGPIYYSGRNIDIIGNSIINANIEAGSLIRIDGNIISSNLIAGTNMEIVDNIISSNITSNIDLRNFAITTTIPNGNIRIIPSGNGAVEITQSGIGSTTNILNPVLRLVNTNDNANGPSLEFYKNSATPASGDIAGIINFYGNLLDTDNTKCLVTSIYSSSYPTTSTVSGTFTISCNISGTQRDFLRLNDNNTGVNNLFGNYTTNSTNTGSLVLQNYNTSAPVQLCFQGQSGRSSALQEIARQSFSAFNSAGTNIEYGRISQFIRSNISASEMGYTSYFNRRVGGLGEYIRLDGNVASSGVQAGIVINPGGTSDIDFIYRSQTTNLIWADYGNNAVGIGGPGLSGDRLRVYGNITTTTSITTPTIIVGTGTGTANMNIMAVNTSLTGGTINSYLNVTVNGVNYKMALHNP
jgi:hypothetical protein